ncbi:MAG: hypothetical protein IJ282_00535 [Lachnospiraceae bacterium]|nr:hypothetical protein [Lachnospiraceae bacterium]
MKKIFVLCFATVMLFATSIPVSAEGCGDWDTEWIGDAQCESDGCGFLWMNETNKAPITLYRLCVTNENIAIRQYKHTSIDLGCCQ